MRLVALIIALLLALIAPERALAHASLVSSNPDDGALLRAAPDVVELTFNEPVEALSLMLVSPQGDTVRLDGGRTATEKLRLTVPSGLAQGSHLLSWRVVSADGHPVGGSLVFSIGKASGGDPAAQEGAVRQITATNPWALVLARWLLLVGLFFGIGGALYLMQGQEQPITRRLVEAALLIGVLAAIAMIGLEGLEAHDLPLSSYWRRLTWQTGLRAHQTLTVALAIAGMVLATVATRLPRGNLAFRIATLAGLGFVGLLVSGHAITAPPAWMVGPALAAHIATVALWAGALFPLAVIALRPTADLAQLRSFSKWAVLLFGAIVGSGFILALAQAGSWSSLLASTYGQLLLIKVGLVAAVLAVAAYNRYHLTQPALAGDTLARRTLGRAIAAEALIAVLILGVVATWRITPPPRALAQMREPKFQIHMHGTDAMASVLIQPARAGPVKVVIEPKTPDLVPLAVKEVTISLAADAGGMEPLRREARLVSGNKWEIEGLTIPTAGRWRVRIELLIDDFERTGLDAVIVVRQ